MSKKEKKLKIISNKNLKNTLVELRIAIKNL